MVKIDSFDMVNIDSFEIPIRLQSTDDNSVIQTPIVQGLFETTTGYFSILCKEGNIKEVRDERPLATLPEKEQESITLYMYILYAMIYGTEDLQDETN
jgi:hypothetical protein